MEILKIESFDHLPREEAKKLMDDVWSSYEGYKITTNEKHIYILISNESNCCESWGHIQSEDDLQQFIGANILDYRAVDNADYNDIELTKKEAGEYVDCYDCAFLDFNTDKGTFQLAVYNHHNGYYGHDIRIVEKP